MVLFSKEHSVVKCILGGDKVEKRVIGILGGMGPRATAPFLELVIDQCTVQYGAKYDEDFPPIMVYSLPTPFYMNRPINHTLMKETIIKGLQKLESTGVSFIVLPCSSAHMYFDELEKCINIPLLNNAELTINSYFSRTRACIQEKLAGEDQQDHSND